MTPNTKRKLSGMINLFVTYIETNRVSLDDATSSDRLLIEMWCDDSVQDNSELDRLYYKHEDHIHDVVETIFLDKQSQPC